MVPWSFLLIAGAIFFIIAFLTTIVNIILINIFKSKLNHLITELNNLNHIRDAFILTQIKNEMDSSKLLKLTSTGSIADSYLQAMLTILTKKYPSMKSLRMWKLVNFLAVVPTFSILVPCLIVLYGFFSTPQEEVSLLGILFILPPVFLIFSFIKTAVLVIVHSKKDNPLNDVEILYTDFCSTMKKDH